MFKLLFSLGSRKLDDWLPATTTSCTWEAVFSPIPTYYFPFPSYASGQPASISLFFFFLWSSGPGAWVCLGSTQVEIKLAPSRCFRWKWCVGAKCLSFWSPTPPCQVNGPLWADWNDSDGVLNWMFPLKHSHSDTHAPLLLLALSVPVGSIQTNQGLQETTCHYENILKDYRAIDRIQVGVDEGWFRSDLRDIRLAR